MINGGHITADIKVNIVRPMPGHSKMVDLITHPVNERAKAKTAMKLKEENTDDEGVIDDKL